MIQTILALTVYGGLFVSLYLLAIEKLYAPILVNIVPALCK